MADAVDLVEQWAQRCGLDASWARRQAAAVLVDPVDWVSIVGEVVADGAKWILDLGPSDTVTRLSSSLVRGTGVGSSPRRCAAVSATCSHPAACPTWPAPGTVTHRDWQCCPTAARSSIPPSRA